MRIAKLSAVALTIVILVAGSLAASGFRGLDVGHKAVGLGGAFTAVADDWTAAWYNPAGYAEFYDDQLGLSHSFAHYRNEITPSFRWGDQFETGVLNDRTAYNDHQILSLPTAGFAVRLPVWGETVFGLSAYQPFDYQQDWKLYQHMLAYNESTAVPASQYLNNFDIVAFQLTAAREFVSEKLSLGLGLAVLRADLLYNDVTFRPNPYLQIDADWQYAHRPYDQIVNWSHQDGYGFGFGFNAGLLWRQSDNLTLGLRAFVPTNITVDGEGTVEYYMPEVPYSQYDDPDLSGSVEMLLKSGSLVVDSSDFESTLSLPPVFAAGGAWQMSERLRLSLDLEYTVWSQFDGFKFEYTSHNLSSEPMYRLVAMKDSMMVAFLTSDLDRPVDWSNALKAMLGVEYSYSDKLDIRLGGSYDQASASDDELAMPQTFDLGPKLGFGGGFTVHLEQWDLGVAANYIHHDDVASAGLVDLNNDGIMDNLTGDYAGDTYQLVTSLNYRF